MGTYPYIAPEQFLGSRDDPRSDIFALGAMIYQAATGKLPFGKPETLRGVRPRLWRDPIPPRALVPDLPEWLQEIILRALEVDPEEVGCALVALLFCADEGLAKRGISRVHEGHCPYPARKRRRIGSIGEDLRRGRHPRDGLAVVDDPVAHRRAHP